jgi:hypothetical protein
MNPSLLDNTPWWLPDVTVTGGGPGVLVQRCDPFGHESALRGLEGGFYGPEHLGTHMWHCTARADAKYRARCRCGHKGRTVWLCNGHAYSFRHRMSQVCPPCVHPPREIEIQAAMNSVRTTAYELPTLAALRAAESRLWDLQAQLNELVDRGIVHRCPVRLEEAS